MTILSKFEGASLLEFVSLGRCAAVINVTDQRRSDLVTDPAKIMLTATYVQSNRVWIDRESSMESFGNCMLEPDLHVRHAKKIGLLKRV